jgi:hypothetical protein
MRAFRSTSFTAPRPPSGILPSFFSRFITTSSTAANTARTCAFATCELSATAWKN